MSRDKHVLVVGATGKQGGSVIKSLMTKGYRVRGLTRNPSSKIAIDLHNSGAEIAVGDFIDADSLSRALDKIDTVFLVTTAVQAEVAQGTAMIDAARKARVGHLVFSSVASANKHTGIPHFDTKYEIEQHLEKSGLAYTIVGPTAFMENFIQPFSLPALAQGKLSRAIPPERKVQMIALDDIGAFVGCVIATGEPFFGKRIDIAGDELNGVETAAIISRVVGREIKYEELPLDAIRARSPERARMFEWQRTNDYTADIRELHRSYKEVRWHTLQEWARTIDWKSMIGT